MTAQTPALVTLLLALGGCASSATPDARDSREPSAPPPIVAAQPADSPPPGPPPGPPPSTPTDSATPPPTPTGLPPAPQAPARPTSADTVLNPIETVRGIHDPAIIRQGDWFYCFSTGAGIPIHRSRDLVNWEPIGRVFANDVPPWAKQEIPASVNIWAPDIQLIDGRYVLTYSVATFGQNRSLIAMASTPTLDPADRRYRWRNDGKIVESFVGDDFNAIDSNLFVDANRAVVFFGSYWTGVKMVELDRQTLKPRPNAPRVNIARRETSGGIEAPFVVQRQDWYYVFLSFDKCCAGVDSTYNVRVGRSRSLDGPYYDRDNKPLMRGGGTRLLQTEGRVIGPGHCCVFQEEGRWYIGYHFYDADANGVQTLQVRELLWDHLGWPRAGAAIGGV